MYITKIGTAREKRRKENGVRKLIRDGSESNLYPLW
jgi:hypothetical protein